MTFVSFASWLYVAACAAVIAFQFALVFGAPWGHLTQGGRTKGTLPPSGRVAAGMSVLLLAAMALAILSAAEQWPEWPAWTGWATLGVQSLAVAANWATPSAAERRIWGPVTTGMLLLAVIVVIRF